ncbi:unnamed protein product [Mycena citricolor]|uniref:Yeast cell wall synthesis Kre9/Knh1-like N-terminal domain-containing protein n=1 Tax=Mycena citricolor TaxID=2018698 RepID=A0AAD2H2H2_9AGAR|nr:unnamed protein product [Mycena citricolor]
MKFTTTFVTLVSAMLSVSSAAAVVPPHVLDVFEPPITSPTTGDVWTVGWKTNITWDVSHAPKQITNNQGRIMLRKANYTTPLILAEGFNITVGQVEIIVPSVITGDDYQLVLFGSSGNFSPYFTISGA